MPPQSSRRIFVDSEFAPRRLVVLAQCQMRLPDVEPGSAAQLNDEMAMPPGAAEDNPPASREGSRNRDA